MKTPGATSQLTLAEMQQVDAALRTVGGEALSAATQNCQSVGGCGHHDSGCQAGDGTQPAGGSGQPVRTHVDNG